MKLHNVSDLEHIRNQYQRSYAAQKKKILICGGTGCVAGGSFEIFDRLQELMAEKGIDCELTITEEPHDDSIGLNKSGCHGFCEMGPLLRIDPEGILYLKVKIEDCEEILEKTILHDQVIERLVYKENGEIYTKQDEIPFYKKQTRIALEHCGQINAESIEEYIATGGYQAFSKALFDMSAQEIVDVITDAKLRGRGGGGFLTGRKWAQVLRQKEPEKYIVCNGDEGDPGAFMDRSIMEGDPHRVIEGMLIAGVATQAENGYIYVRAEYPLAVSRLTNALNQAQEMGLLGDNILNSGFNFHLHINQGAGAFVCGEGSALTASIEGKRGMPRVKPPRTVEKGLFEKPTVLNNVETFAHVSAIIVKGADWYTAIGTEHSPGTKAFALTGNIKHTGLIEVPMGTSVKDIIFDIGGGVKDGKKFKAVQIGGPSGGCLCMDEAHLNMPMDFDSLKKLDAMIGSGGLVVMDEDTCMVEVSRFFMNFTQNESCGKCVPCREGTKRMLEILERIVGGDGTMEDLDMLEELADTISSTALCGLGKSAASPVKSTLRYFRDEYIAHVRDKVCPAGECDAFKSYEIDPQLCKGCSKCAKGCPVDAIKGKIKEPFVIDKEICIKCGACTSSCPFHAIMEV